MALAAAYRSIVVARAGGACEYCRLLEAATGVTFHIEHVLPRTHGGMMLLDNLAVSCPGCNLAKGDRVSAKDRRGREQPLFNPRAFQSWLLGWHVHFILDRESGLISALVQSVKPPSTLSKSTTRIACLRVASKYRPG